MSEPTGPTGRHEAAPAPAPGSGQRSGTPENPWLKVLGIGGGLAALAGIIAYGAGYDEATSTGLLGQSDPSAGLAAMFAGEMLLTFGITMLMGWLVAGAICWQLRRR